MGQFHGISFRKTCKAYENNVSKFLTTETLDLFVFPWTPWSSHHTRQTSYAWDKGLNWNHWRSLPIRCNKNSSFTFQVWEMIPFTWVLKTRPQSKPKSSESVSSYYMPRNKLHPSDFCIFLYEFVNQIYQCYLLG